MSLKNPVTPPVFDPGTIRLEAQRDYTVARLKTTQRKPKGKKDKGRLWVLQHCCLEAYCTLTRMSSFILLQRRCTHQAA